MKVLLTAAQALCFSITAVGEEQKSAKSFFITDLSDTFDKEASPIESCRSQLKQLKQAFSKSMHLDEKNVEVGCCNLTHSDEPANQKEKLVVIFSTPSQNHSIKFMMANAEKPFVREKKEVEGKFAEVATLRIDFQDADHAKIVVSREKQNVPVYSYETREIELNPDTFENCESKLPPRSLDDEKAGRNANTWSYPALFSTCVKVEGKWHFFFTHLFPQR